MIEVNISSIHLSYSFSGESMKCNLDIPYPKIKVQKKDSGIAKMLMHSYAGDVSEDTAIHQYIFQSFLLQDVNNEISNILEEIGKVEMHHLRILGLLIKELGVYPLYLDPIVDRYEFWNGNYVCYDTDLFHMLKADIESEKKAILEYNSLIHVIDDRYIKEILKRIVLDERLHLEILEKLLLSID